MLAETIKSPEDYMLYFEHVWQQTGAFENCPQINKYYNSLHKQFITIYYDQELLPFIKWGKLLEVDAQVQILLELTKYTKQNLTEEIGMSEEQIIRMIDQDKKSYYRELTGKTILQKPSWGLIYLSEE